MENRNLEKFIIGIILIVLLLLSIIIGAKENKKETKPSTVEQNVVSELKDPYINGCMGEGSDYKFCDCTYNVLINELGEKGFIELSIEYLKTEQIPEKVVNKLIASCSDQL